MCTDRYMLHGHIEKLEAFESMSIHRYGLSIVEHISYFIMMNMSLITNMLIYRMLSIMETGSRTPAPGRAGPATSTGSHIRS